MKLIDVEMQKVEFFRAFTYPVEHQHVIGDRVADIAVEAQCHASLGVGGGLRNTPTVPTCLKN